MKKTKAKRALAARASTEMVRDAIVSEQRFADERIKVAVISENRIDESFFSGYRNGLGFAFRCVIDSSVEAPAAPLSRRHGGGK